MLLQIASTRKSSRTRIPRALGCRYRGAQLREREGGDIIDLSILPDLTDQDLEKLGVVLGHRRKLSCTRM